MTSHSSLDAPIDILNVNGVEVAIDGRVILRDVDFRIEAGEFTGLIGSNGSGKTTLFRVILGLQPTVAVKRSRDVTAPLGTCPKRCSSIPRCHCALATLSPSASMVTATDFDVDRAPYSPTSTRC
jgi:energy-coupling factor transporter ATP-binding protein EcfA2